MNVAAYQAPLLRSGSLEAVDLIRTRVEWCESLGLVILCCPEAILGGLADYARTPANSRLTRAVISSLARLPLSQATQSRPSWALPSVTSTGRLYNSAVHTDEQRPSSGEGGCRRTREECRYRSGEREQHLGHPCRRFRSHEWHGAVRIVRNHRSAWECASVTAPADRGADRCGSRRLGA